MTTSDARIAHVGIALADLDGAIAFHRDVLGLDPSTPVTADGASIVSLDVGGVDVELMSPVEPESPIAKFLAKRGPGIHHICYRVPDLDATLRLCREQGYQLVDEKPRPGAGGRRVAFLHPKTTHGVLIEFTE
ncbi:MAG: methylmalonyl-CoA epimerase [Gemmatimonadales bacterium]